MRCLIKMGLITVLLSTPVHAQTLDHLSGPLIPQGRYLYTVGTGYFHLQERGTHGSASFGEFSSEPDYWSIINHFTFTPLKNTELHFGVVNNFSTESPRYTYNPMNVLVFQNDYRLNQFHEFDIDLRHRRGNTEFYLNSFHNDLDSQWHSAPGFVEGDFFTDIQSHFEDIKIGARQAHEQWDWKGHARYRHGMMRRTNTYYPTTPDTRRNYYQDLRAHVTFGLEGNYRQNDQIEYSSGLIYTLPYKYKFEFQQFNPSSTTNFISATYRLSQQFHIPLGVDYQYNSAWRFNVRSDLNYAKQRGDIYEKETTDLFSNVSTRTLHYFQTMPTLEVSYFYDAGLQSRDDIILKVTNNLLCKSQFKFTLTAQQDFTHLNKEDGNGSQNIIDPYHIFKSPLENFQVGTEYAAFLTGNSSSAFSNVKPQDYSRVQAAFQYGILDNLNMEIKAGFQSRSSVHQYVFENNISNRHYVFEPYYFYELNTDWQVTKDSLFEVDVYFVPRYKTFLETDIHPEPFKARTEYIHATVKFSYLF